MVDGLVPRVSEHRGQVASTKSLTVPKRERLVEASRLCFQHLLELAIGGGGHWRHVLLTLFPDNDLPRLSFVFGRMRLRVTCRLNLHQICPTLELLMGG